MAEPGMTAFERAESPRTWDFLLTGLFIVVMLVLVVAFAFSALSFGALNQSCAGGGCDDFRVRLGQQICTFAPPVIALVAIVWSIVRVARRRIAFWIALLGVALMAGTFFGGRLIMDSGLS